MKPYWILAIIIFPATLFPALTLGRTTSSAPAAFQPPPDWSDAAENDSDKPWVRDFAQFVNDNPNQHWLLAQSPSPCLSEDEAMQKALNHAASQLAPLVRPQVNASASHRFRQLKNATGQPLEPLILKHLESTGLIRDRFVQKFERPYGDVWRESLLIDASPQNITRLSNAIAADLTKTKTGLRNTIFSTLGLLAVICGVYYLMDAITKGYFKTRLRIVAVSLAIIGIFLLLFLV